MSDEFEQTQNPDTADAKEWRSADAAGILRRHKARARLLLIVLIAVVLGGGYWYFNRSFSLSLDQVVSLENNAENKVLDELGKTFSAPPPLVAPKGPVKRSVAPSSNILTANGVIADTNTERKINGGLPELTENTVLDAIATLRLDDMFQNQYFAHVSPYTSSSAETIAKTVDYSYLALGENLALGNFGGDQGVVGAWMASPGHRANILDSHYTEIGVAVRQGVFDGQMTWLAVQVFGRPASDCPAPDAAQKAKIDAESADLAQIGGDLAAKKAALGAMQPQYGAAYNQAVDEYNAEVNQYNALLAQVKVEVAVYNAAVQAFNQCIGA